MELYYLAAAIATTTALHSAMEPSNLLDKTKRLQKAINTGKIDEPKLKGIDTRTKSYAVGITFMALPAIITYFVVQAIEPSTDNLLLYIIGVLVVGELTLMARLDQWHILAEKITQSHKSNP